MTGEEGYTVRGQNRYTIDSWSRKHTGQVAFFLGLFVGAGSALLLTSMSGREAREKILSTTKLVTGGAGSYYSVARDAVTGVVEKGKTLFQQAGPALTSAIQAAKEAYTSEKSKVADEIAEG